jgi:hypothetical protein
LCSIGGRGDFSLGSCVKTDVGEAGETLGEDREEGGKEVGKREGERRQGGKREGRTWTHLGSEGSCSRYSSNTSSLVHSRRISHSTSRSVTVLNLIFLSPLRLAPRNIGRVAPFLLRSKSSSKVWTSRGRISVDAPCIRSVWESSSCSSSAPSGYVGWWRRAEHTSVCKAGMSCMMANSRGRIRSGRGKT